MYCALALSRAKCYNKQKTQGGTIMKYGFIGLGNMAGAIISGMAASGKFTGDSIYGYNRSEGKTVALKDKCGLIPCSSATEVVNAAEVVILSVKPQVMPTVLSEISHLLTPDKTVISLAAGKPTSWYEEKLPAGDPLVRVMPNLAATVKMAVSALCGGKSATE